jgi:hypothetical protein
MAASPGLSVANGATGISAHLSIIAQGAALEIDARPRLTIELENTSAFPVWVNGRGNSGGKNAPASVRELWLDITNSAGRQYPYSCFDKARSVRASDYVSLGPGKTLKFSVDMLCYSIKSPGAYTFVAHYQDGNTNMGIVPGTPVLLGELVSAPVGLEFVLRASPGAGVPRRP